MTTSTSITTSTSTSCEEQLIHAQKAGSFIKAAEYIATRVPAISSEYKSKIRTDRYGNPFFKLVYKDIEMPSDVATGFKRMYHSANIFEEENGKISIVLSLNWETFQGGMNGVTIFNEYVK